ncbi:hypothetical protein ACIPPR_33800 [Streptomyces nigra]|uniref:hypothetical protein n=1 Tax=Streptomyces nigra TaxID=1827580 RepID=UPI00380E9108
MDLKDVLAEYNTEPALQAAPTMTESLASKEIGSPPIEIIRMLASAELTWYLAAQAGEGE